jgi:hypothetical protein
MVRDVKYAMLKDVVNVLEMDFYICACCVTRTVVRYVIANLIKNFIIASIAMDVDILIRHQFVAIVIIQDTLQKTKMIISH